MKAKVILVIKGQPTCIIERSESGEIKIIQRRTGIHATYHLNGHNHFYDPRDRDGSFKKERYEIALKLAQQRGEQNPESYAKRQASCVNCTTGKKIKDIDQPEHFIGFRLRPTAWKNKYKKLDQIKLPDDWDNELADFYLTQKMPKDKKIVPIIGIAHPMVFIKKAEKSISKQKVN